MPSLATNVWKDVLVGNKEKDCDNDTDKRGSNDNKVR